jgi:nitroreductase
VIFPAGSVSAMPDQPTGRLADTSVPINAHIAGRWSPRVFDPDAVLDPTDLVALLEAARWAATWGGRQPVRFVVGRRVDETFTELTTLLRRGNRYATNAAALILVCADQGEDERTALYSGVDAGAAMANLAIEARARGLHAHPMAGFDAAGAQRAFAIPDGVRPLAIVAVGRLGDYATAPPEIAERDTAPRERLPLDQIVFAGTWGRPAPL